MALDLYTLRNAARVVMVVQDARTGQIYRVDDAPWVPKSGLDDITYTAAPAGTFFWDGTGSDGAPLPGGTRVNVSFYAWLESDAAMAAAYRRAEPDPMDPASYRWLTGYDRALAWRFPVTVDRAAPTAEADLAGDTLTITLSDSQYLAHAAVYDGDGNLLAEESYADEKAGQKHDLTLDLTGYGGLETVYVTAADYAANQSGFSIDLIALAAGEEIDPTLCAAALLTDVDRGAWYHDAVDYAYAAGLMGEGLTFRPGENATRIQVISALYRLAGRPETGGARVPFTDVPGNADFKDDLRWAYENGLATGYSDTFFGPYANIPRQQLAALLLRYAALGGEPGGADPAALDAFSDKDAVSSWAADALAWAVEADILSGRPDGTLDPRGYVTRAELAEILMNFAEMP